MSKKTSGKILLVVGILLANYIEKNKEKVYSNRLFDININGHRFATFIDTGAFKSLMSKKIAEKFFPEQNRHKILVSGYTQNAKWIEMIKNIKFIFKNEEFNDDFLIENNLETIFKSEIVLGIDAYNKMLLHFYGKTLENLFDKDPIPILEDYDYNDLLLDRNVCNISLDSFTEEELEFLQRKRIEISKLKTR